jgi:hypothetical protein
MVISFSAKLGGWLGVVNGVSLCSITEMTVYVFVFVYKMNKAKTDWP